MRKEASKEDPAVARREIGEIAALRQQLAKEKQAAAEAQLSVAEVKNQSRLAAAETRMKMQQLEAQLNRARNLEGVDWERGGAGWRSRVVAFYEKHNPRKLPCVDELMAKYYGYEQLLLNRLHRKYVGDLNASMSSGVDSDCGEGREGGVQGEMGGRDHHSTQDEVPHVQEVRALGQVGQGAAIGAPVVEGKRKAR